MMEFLHGIYQGNYWFSRFLLQRCIGFIYLIAFTNALNQFIPLLGENGLLPLPDILPRLSFKERPSIFHWHYSDRFFRIAACTGIIFSILTVTGLADAGGFFVSMATWTILWLLYLSIVNAGTIFYGFGWESMLLEAGFYMIFLGPAAWAAPVLVIWMMRWMLFRVEFGAGLIKLRGDPCWRNLSCMNYHHETQPQPNPTSWYAHNLPEGFHKAETFANFAVQLVVVWGLFFPQPVAAIAAVIIILSQSYLFITGNYSWLNFLTIFLAFSGFSDGVIQWTFGLATPAVSALPLAYVAVIVVLSLVVIYMSIGPVRNMLSSHQRMNASFNPVHLVNTYGAFGSVTKKRYEIVIEGTRDKEPDENSRWLEYEFKGKPGKTKRQPPQLSPYHLRLDWQMWFAAMSRSPRSHPWFRPFITKLLKGDEPTLKLLLHNPFEEEPPLYIRAGLYRYQFTTFKERRQTGQWWKRDYMTEYMAPVSLGG